ncbi:Arabinose efflux permease family protein [Cupriavidus necator]|uniref:Arabinose efflux permease family protein n=1 Tax=Cupriavidus necator TaxID=106590 RepID=A0A1K0IMV4_CUPNE|nr:Arabinose efflux permease family protein [Cupriavidus necator]
MKTQDTHAAGTTIAGAQDLTDVSSGRAWYTVGVLLVAYIFSIMDRQILTLLVGPIQQTLGVNDTLMGLLHGFTFAAFYALMGLPIARVIDRGDRRLVIAVGIALWSLATAAGGLATEYWHLLLARVGVAVGEAVLLPGTVSLIADLFPAERRGRAMSIFGASGPFGSGAGLIAGGLILGVFTVSAPVLPWFGALHPWQATFIALGLPGVIVALFMLAAPEPRKLQRNAATGGQRGGTVAASEAVPVVIVRRYIAENRRTMVALMLGAGFFYTSVYAWSSWAPTYFVREFGWKYAEIGKVLGLLLAIAGPVGALLGGWLGGLWKRRGVPHAYLRVALLASIGLTLSVVGMVAAPGAQLAVVFVGMASCFSFFLFGAGPSAIQELAPGPMRGQFAALYTGVLNLLGAGCGPVAVGVLTDYVLRNPTAIRHSIGIVCLLFGAAACVLFRRGFEPYAGTLRQATDWRHTPAASAGMDAVKANAVTS